MGRSVLLLLVLCGVGLYKVQGQQYNATDCPLTCQCQYTAIRMSVKFVYDMGYFSRVKTFPNGVYIHDCTADLYTGLVSIIQSYPGIGGMRIENSLSHTAAEAGHMTTLFTKLATLSSLRYLVISSNQLTVLPDTIGSMSALRELDISNNLLTVLPGTIGSMSALEWLDISNNSLTVLPDTLCAAPPTGVRHKLDQFLCKVTEGCPIGCVCTYSPNNTRSMNISCKDDKEKHGDIK